MPNHRVLVPAPDLSLALPLHELDGSSFMSRDAGGRLCTVTGALWQPNGRAFDGLDDEINLSFKAPVGARTFLCRVHPFDAAHASTSDVIYGETDQTLNSCGNRIYWLHDTHRFGWELYKAVSGQFAFQVQSSAGVSNQPWHLALTWDGSTEANAVKLYLNGALDAQATANITETQPPTYNARIGDDRFEGASPNRHFAGIISGLQIYNRALSAVEIQSAYLAAGSQYR